MATDRTTHFDLSGKRVWVAGHRGMVGSAILRRLGAEDCEILTVGRDEVDLSRQKETEDWVAANRPQAVFVAAARVGGIHANDTCPAEFIYENLAIETNVIHAAWKAGVEKLLFLGSSCIYPRMADQPINEEALLTGPLEPTNEWYAIAKIAGIKLCQAYRRQYGSDFISIMPTNLYGPGDNFDLDSSHVVPALIRKCHEAKTSGQQTVEIWGTGNPAPRVSLRRRSRRRGGPFDEDVFRRATHQRRHRPRPDHSRPCRGRRRMRGLRRSPCLRSKQTRRHAPQASRRQPSERLGLDGDDVFDGWLATGLPLVLRLPSRATRRRLQQEDPRVRVWIAMVATKDAGW